MSTTGQAIGGVVGAAVGAMSGNAIMGAQIGMMVGGYIDPPSGPELKRPSKASLEQQTSTYGVSIPRGYSKITHKCNYIWLQNNRLRIKEIDAGGKGAPSVTAEGGYEYYGTFAIGVCEGPIDKIGRIWCSGKLVYDPFATTLKAIRKSKKFAKKMTIYYGTDTQEPDPAIQADRGVDYTPAYRGLCYLVIRNFLLTDYGNSIMGCDWEVETIKDGGQNSLTLIQEVSEPYKLQTEGSYEHSGTGTVYEPRPFYMSNKKVLWYCPNWDQDTLSEPTSFFTYQTTDSGMSLVGETPLYFSGDTTAFENILTGAGDDKSLYWMFTHWLVGYDSGLSVHNGTFKHINGYNVGVTNTNIVWCAKSKLNIGMQDNVTPPAVFQKEVTDSLCATLDNDAEYVYVLTDTAILKYTKELEYVSSIAHAIASLSNPRICYDAGDAGDYLWIFRTASNHGSTVYKVNLETEAITYVGALTGTSFSSAWGGEYWVEDGIIIFAHPRNTASPPELSVEWYHEGAITSTKQTLDEVVEAECLLSNLIESADLDVTDLTQEVSGFRLNGTAAIRSGLEHLQAAYMFDVFQSGYQLKFINRGGSSVASFTEDDLSSNVQLSHNREMDSQIPYKVVVNCIDADGREYGDNPQYAQRLNSDSKNVHEKDLSLVLTPDECAQVAEKLLYMYWLERETFEFTLPPTASELEPSDIITITTDYAVYELRLTSVSYNADGTLSCAAKPNRSAIYTSTAVGSTGQETDEDLAGNDSDTAYELLDIPCVNEKYLYDAGFYAAVYGDEPDWSGGVIMRSTDGGANFTQLVTASNPTTFGICQNDIGDITQPYMINTSPLLNVKFVEGTPSSITQAQLLDGSNTYAYGADGRWEIIGIQNWELEADGSYTGSQMLRGLFGTEQYADAHLIGDKLVHLNDTDLLWAGSSSGRIGDALTYRGISFGEAIDSDIDKSFTYNAVNLKPLAPVHVVKYKNTSNNWIISWVPQDRLPSNLADGIDGQLSESTEEYRTRIYADSSYDTVLREITSTAPTCTYTSAMQTEDGTSGDAVIYVAIYQMSDVVGYGYPSVAVATAEPTVDTKISNTDDGVIIAGDGISYDSATGELSTDGQVLVEDAASDTTTWLALARTQTGRQALASDAGATYNALTNHIGSKLSASAGGTVAGSAGIYIPAGSLLSTIEAGAIESDGYQIYATQTDGTNGFGREIIYKWSQNNTATASGITTTPTDIYDAPVRLYNNAGAGFTNEVELDIGYTHSGTRGTVTFTFTASAAPTSSGWWIRCNHTDPLGAASLTSGSTATMQNLEYSRDIRASGASVTVMKADITLTAAGTGSVSYRAKFNMMFATQASATITTLNPQISTSAGTISVSGITSAKSRIRGESI